MLCDVLFPVLLILSRGYTLEAHVFDDTCNPVYASRQVIDYLASSNTWLGSVGMACPLLAKRMAQFTQFGRKFVIHFFVESFCASPLWRV